MGKFYTKRTYTEGSTQVDLGIKGGDPRVRVHKASDNPFHLSLEEAEDLADALDRMLADYEEDPLR